MSDSTRPPLTKSPLALAQVALTVGSASLPRYGSRFSRKDYTQAQLFAILALRQFFRIDYRGIVSILKDFSDLREILALETVPHFTTLQKAEAQLLKGGASTIFSALSSLAHTLAA
jgi:hypothetical protein